MENYLPKNWVEVPIKEVAFTASGGTPKTSRKDYWDGDVPWINSGKLKDTRIDTPSRLITELGLKESSAKLFPKGTTVIALTGATTGKVGLLDIETSTNQSVTGIFPNPYYVSEIIFYQLQSLRNVIIGKALGSAQPHINKKIVDETLIKLPPLKEQHRIIQKLDALFAQLDDVKTRLETIPELLKNFRQAVLNKAVTGKLTEEWRKDKDLEDMNEFIRNLSNQRKKVYERNLSYSKENKLKRPKKDYQFDFNVHPTKPKWSVAKLENLIYMSARIGWKGLKADEYTDEGPLFLSVHSLNYGENVNFDVAYHITNERYDESPEIMLKENDILLCKDGAGIGKLGIVKDLSDKATVNSSLLVIRGREAVNYKFLYYFLSGPALQNIARERITGTAVPHLFQRDIKEFRMEIPPLLEQKEIVKIVESLLSKIYDIEERYLKLDERVKNLPQSLLHKAFKGELVEQLPTDGDAKDLLVEIKKLKEEIKPKRKKKRRL